MTTQEAVEFVINNYTTAIWSWETPISRIIFSGDRLGLAMDIEMELDIDIYDEEINEWETFADLLELVERRVQANRSETTLPDHRIQTSGEH